MTILSSMIESVPYDAPPALLVAHPRRRTGLHRVRRPEADQAMNTMIKAPPTARFENRFPPDEEFTEVGRAARRERTRRAAAAYAAFKAAGGERIVHRTPERLRAAVERRRQRIEAFAGGAPGRHR